MRCFSSTAPTQPRGFWTLSQSFQRHLQPPAPPKPEPPADVESDAPSEAPTESESFEESSDDELSDENDIFAAPGPSTTKSASLLLATLPERWHQATQEMAVMLGHDLTLPLRQEEGTTTEVYTDVDVPLRLPRWRCPFRGCKTCEAVATELQNHEKSWWSHIYGKHNKEFLDILRSKKFNFSKRGDAWADPEAAFTLMFGAMQL